MALYADGSVVWLQGSHRPRLSFQLNQVISPGLLRGSSGGQPLVSARPLGGVATLGRRRGALVLATSTHLLWVELGVGSSDSRSSDAPAFATPLIEQHPFQTLRACCSLYPADREVEGREQSEQGSLWKQ